MSFDFISHCKNCPSSTTHCCTKKGNIILINDAEKKHINSLFEELKPELNINVENYKLFNDAETQNGVTPLTLIVEKDKDTNEEIDRCPFFSKPKCLIHERGKPLDCKLWPVSKFENGNKSKVYVDINCSAINAQDKIPTTTVEESISLFNSLEDVQKEVYFKQSSEHYILNSIPIKIWDKFQDFKAVYKQKLDNTIEELNQDLDKLENKFVSIDFNSKDVLYITKWIVGIFFASIVGALINQSVGNVENFKIENLDFIKHFQFGDFFNVGFRILTISFITVIFIGDTYRIIIPLPWIIKDYSEKPFKELSLLRDKFKNKDLPSYQVTKFVIIGVLSFLLLNIMAIKFVYEPLYYLLIYGLIMALDLSWYFINKKRLDVIIYFLKITFLIFISFLFCAISGITLYIPFVFSVIVLVFFILFNYILPYSKFPLQLNKTKMFAKIINQLFFYFTLPSVENEKERIRNKIQTRCSDEIFKKEKDELQKYSEEMGQSVDSVIGIFLHEKTKLASLKNTKLDVLEEKINIAQKCEQYIYEREKELAKEYSFIIIGILDFVVCFIPALIIILNKHFFEIQLISDFKYLILLGAFFIHSGLMFLELFLNNFYKNYLETLFLKFNND